MKRDIWMNIIRIMNQYDVVTDFIINVVHISRSSHFVLYLDYLHFKVKQPTLG